LDNEESDSTKYSKSSIEAKTEVQDYECISNGSLETRKIWCKKTFSNDNDISGCLNKFCEICCNGLKDDCKSKCNANVQKSNIDTNAYFGSCFSVIGENNMVRNNECKACCKNLMTPYIKEDSYSKCLSDCDYKYDKREGLFNSGTESFFIEDY